ncbi:MULTISPECIES: thioesterase, FlK family [Paraburkholderia]|uniref:thioesterase, FlK family n=1 Tax=Paraburkholderia caledonica TaxID=134536 RepID=UPI000B48995A|nr:2-hydroxychromene-2-carboxylate isomerase [Burkholderia sp. Bk]
MNGINVGRTIRCDYVPTVNDTAAKIGNDGVHAVSTPAVIALVEETCHSNIKGGYSDGQGSVGTSVNVRHIAPAWPGRVLTVESTVERFDRRAVLFNVSVTQDARTVMTGSHERALVELARFANPDQAVGSAPSIEFFFDFHSPWCYLAITRILEIAKKHGAAIIWKPIHLANLIEQIDGRRPLDANGAFVRWYKQDLQDWAARRNLVVRYHPDFPLRPSRALRCAVHAVKAGKGAEFILATMSAYWSEGRDISDLSILSSIAESVALCSRELVAAVDEDVCKRTVIDNTSEAIKRGVFGAPSLFVEGKLFWGNDRLDLLDEHLMRNR